MKRAQVYDRSTHFTIPLESLEAFHIDTPVDSVQTNRTNEKSFSALLPLSHPPPSPLMVMAAAAAVVVAVVVVEVATGHFPLNFIVHFFWWKEE